MKGVDKEGRAADYTAADGYAETYVEVGIFIDDFGDDIEPARRSVYIEE